MSADLGTWEAAIEGTQPPPEAPSDTSAIDTSTTDPAVTEDPAPTEQLEVAEPSGDAPQVEAEAEPTAEKVEEPVDDKQPEVAADIQADDSPEIKALPTPAARRWARQRDKEARLADTFHDPHKPIGDFAEDLSKRSLSRYKELVADFFTNHGDQYIQNRYGIAAADVDARVKATPAAPNTADPDDPSYDPYTDDLIPESVKAQLRETDALKAKMTDIEGKVQTFETKEQERERLATEQKANAISNEVFDAVFPVVGEAIEEYGLKEDPNDPPIIAGLKEAGRELLLTNVDPVFMESEENRKATERVREFAKRLEKDNAHREVDALKVRSRAATEQIRQMRKLDAVLSAIQQLSESKAKKITERGKGSVPVPASVPGGSSVPKSNIASWDDAYASVGQ